MNNNTEKNPYKTEQVILVDEADNERGAMEKLEAHRKGELHRAFSVFIFNGAGEMLLQKRAATKYHSSGLWTNACCSHPRPGENTLSAAHRRLKEEMGLDAVLIHKTSFVYKTVFENGLTEHEFDHIYTGITDAQPLPDPGEVAEFAWLQPDVIKQMIKEKPGDFTSWFKIAIDKFF